MKYLSGNLVVLLTKTKGINAANGKVYAKSYVFPNVLDAKLMSDTQGKSSAYSKTEDLKATENLKFETAMSVSCKSTAKKITRKHYIK